MTIQRVAAYEAKAGTAKIAPATPEAASGDKVISRAPPGLVNQTRCVAHSKKYNDICRRLLKHPSELLRGTCNAHYAVAMKAEKAAAHAA